MQALCILSVEVIGCAEHLDELDIVTGKMEFGDVETVMDAKINEYVFVCMESGQCIIEELEGGSGMNRILCEVEKIEQSAYGMKEVSIQMSIGKTNINDQAEEKPTNLVMLLASDMRK